VRKLDPANLTESVKVILRLPKTKTIVGGLLFDHTLNETELKYEISLVRHGYTHSLINPMTQSHALYTFFSGASQELKGIKRMTLHLEHSTEVIQITGHGGIEWVTVLVLLKKVFV
jgi:hypothetical protein